LARAFDDDPYFRWMLPAEANRAKWLTWILRAMIEQDAVHRTVFGYAKEGALCGVLSALPPGSWPVTLRDYVRAAAASGRMPLPTLRVLKSLRTQYILDGKHPKQNHWYVHALGVEPSQQRTGGGRALLTHVLELADAASVPTHLETAKRTNVSYYERFGFRVIEELATVPGAPPLWTMTRTMTR
jgi:ribosomal protein S18 acetylase RimI-like enzyme